MGEAESRSKGISKSGPEIGLTLQGKEGSYRTQPHGINEPQRIVKAVGIEIQAGDKWISTEVSSGSGIVVAVEVVA